MGAVVASQGDPLATFRLGAGMGRKMLREASHDPEMLSQLATDAAHGAIQEAAGSWVVASRQRSPCLPSGLFWNRPANPCWFIEPMTRPRWPGAPPPPLPSLPGSNTAEVATHAGYHAAEHATIADKYDAWKLAAGLNDRRRLGADAEPATISGLAGLVMQGEIAKAASGGSVSHATAMGREATVAGTVGTHLDTEFHLGAGELPEGPLTRVPEDDRPPWANGSWSASS
jgi:hypothetical protein